jgi:transposase
LVETILGAQETKPGTRKGRPNYPREFKEKLVQAAREPGVSVSKLAREHGINANLLFKWCRHEQTAESASPPAQEHITLLPVDIVATTDDAPPKAKPNGSRSAPLSMADAAPAGMIEIDCGGAVVRIHGRADPATLVAVLQNLRP